MKIIGRGRYATETYPEAARAAAAGAIVHLGFDNSTGTVAYNVGMGAVSVVRFNDGPPLSVPLTGFKPGNLILIHFSITAVDGIASGPAGSQITVQPTIDLGAGPRTIDMPSAGTNGFTLMPALSWLTFVTPVPGDITADPIVQLLLIASENDPTHILGQGALLMAAEIDAAFITQQPTTFLDP